jgi:16S rRNA processing protein RimM
MRDTEELIPVGKIIGTHGVRGQMKLHSYSGNFDSLGAGRSVLLKKADGTLHGFTLKGAKANNGKFIISLTGFDDMDSVEPLMGSELCIKRSNLPEPDEDEYYWCDLIGLQVFTDEGILLGSITDIFETGSSDIYVVNSGDREYLIPAIGTVIKSIDLDNGRIIVTPLEGLLDL